MPSLSSDRVNYLIWRYFQEEGLALSGYALDKETHVAQEDGKLGREVAAGQLVTLLLKGLQMTEIEAATGSLPTLASELSTSTDGIGSALPSSTQQFCGFDITGVEYVETPNRVKFIGGVAAAFNAPMALVIAGSDSTVAYVAQPNDECSATVFECADTPTCVEPLGVGIQGPDQSVLVGYASGCARQWQFSDRCAVMQSVLYPRNNNGGPLLLVRGSPSGTRAVGADAKTGEVSIWELAQRRLVCAVDFTSANGFAAPSEEPASKQTRSEGEPETENKTETKTETKTEAEAAGHGESKIGDIVWIGGDSTLAVAYGSSIAVINVPDVPEGIEEPNVQRASNLVWLRGHTKPVAVLAFDELAQLIASGGDDGCVCVWNAQSQEPVHRLVVGAPNTPITHVSWLGMNLLTSTTDGKLQLWDVRSKIPTIAAETDVGEPVFALEVSKHMPTHVAVITPEGCRVYMLNLHPPSFTAVGSVLAKDTQCISWANDQSLAVTARSTTVVVRC